MDGVASGVAHNLDGKVRTDDVRLKELAPFSKMLLKDVVRKGLARTGFVYPTVIQAAAIPVGKSGLDLLVQSKSGTGKTLIFATILLEAYRSNVSLPQSLIVAPTREIAVQIEAVLNQIGCCADGFRACCVIGGLDVVEDRRRLQGARAVVGTPGRLLHLIQNDVLNTSQITLLVLDEADKMYTSSFRNDLQRIQRALPSRRQTIACSATFCDNLDVELARIMRQPLLISTDQRATLLLGIKQFAYELPEYKTSILEMQAKLAALRDIFGRVSFKQCLIFAGSQSRADSYCTYLSREGWPCELMSGAQSQQTRLELFRKFRDFKLRILVATDLMSRGIDSEHVNLVINLELPNDVVTYLHRIGRAGRFGSHGIAINFVASEKDRGQLNRLIAKVGSGMNVLKFPSTQIAKDNGPRQNAEKTTEEQPERDLWDFNDSVAEQRHFGLFGQERIAPLASHDKATSLSLEEEAITSPNKENIPDNISIGAAPQSEEPQLNSSSIDTQTFLVDSKDSALNVIDLMPKLRFDSRHSSTHQLQSTSNTIDDASSIAADSQRSSHHDEDISRYQSVLMQKAAIPTLVEFLVDPKSQTYGESEGGDGRIAEIGAGERKDKKKKKPQIDLFEDYQQAIQLSNADEAEEKKTEEQKNIEQKMEGKKKVEQKTEEKKREEMSLIETEENKTVDSPQLTANKLANFKSLLIDKPAQVTSEAAPGGAKQKDIYSDYANFNGDEDDDGSSTSISAQTTTEAATATETTEGGDFDKATFILSVATPSNVPGGGESLEELQNSSLDLSREVNDVTSETSETNSLPEVQHFPSPAHNQPPLPVTSSSIPDVVPPSLRNVIPAAAHKAQKLTVNVGAQIEIPPHQPQLQLLLPAAVAAEIPHPNLSPNISDANDEEAVGDDGTEESSLNTAGGSSADGGGGASSGFDEATTTSASSGIETSEAEPNDDAASYMTSESDDDDFNYDMDENLGTDDDMRIDADNESETHSDDCSEEGAAAAIGNGSGTATAAARSANSFALMAQANAHNSLNLAYQAAHGRWVDMYYNQMTLVQDYVKLCGFVQQQPSRKES